MRKRYVVRANGTFEGFTKADIDKMKNLDMLTFIGSTRTTSGVVYNYAPVSRRFK